jgi:catechol 2,3-dioxygenase-like lactoylglutathione lyase family enzyme
MTLSTRRILLFTKNMPRIVAFYRDGLGLKLRKDGNPFSTSDRPQILTCVIVDPKLTYMEKIQVYLPAEELAALREAAARSGRSVADIIREAIRKQVLKPRAQGPVALWDGEPKRTSIDHDSVHDEV